MLSNPSSLSSSSSSSRIDDEKKTLNPELKKEIENLERKKYFEHYINIYNPSSINNRYNYPIYSPTHLIELSNHLLITESKMTKDNLLEFSGISIWNKESHNRIGWIIPHSGGRITAMTRMNNFLIVGYSGKSDIPKLEIYDISNIHRIEKKKIINIQPFKDKRNTRTHIVTSICTHGNRIACVGYEDFQGWSDFQGEYDYGYPLRDSYIDYFFEVWEIDSHNLDKSIPKKVYTLPEKITVATFYNGYTPPLDHSNSSYTLLHLSNGNLFVPKIGLFDIKKLKPVNAKKKYHRDYCEYDNTPAIEIVNGKFLAKSNVKYYCTKRTIYLYAIGIYDITTEKLVDIINLGHITALTALKDGGFVCSNGNDIQFWYIRNNKWICIKKENLNDSYGSINTISVLHNNIILAITSSAIYSSKKSIISTGYRRLASIKKMTVDKKKSTHLSDSKESCF